MSFRFREFRVYKDAKLWINEIFKLTSIVRKARNYELANQIDRAAISVIMNIAEGSDRGSDKDFNRFLNTSLGSLNEVIAGLDIALSQKIILQSQFDKALLLSENLAKQLGAFKKALSRKP